MIQIKKTILTLVALIAVTTGAWADEGTLLVTITPDGSGNPVYSVDGIATLDKGTAVYNTSKKCWTKGDQTSLTVTVAEGINVTKVKFNCYGGNSWEDKDAPYQVFLYNFSTFSNAELLGIIADTGVTSIEVFGTASSASAVEVAWNKTSKTGTFKMPGGNVELEPEYYDQATVADGGVTAADADARATTDDPLVKVDATKLTGAKKLMYFVSNSGTTAPAYDAEGWTDQLPNAEGFTQQGIVYVWYYPVGTDEGVDGATATYSDGDICLQSITARIAAAPTYAVTFADDLAEPTLWTASPNTGVTKGQTVTVTYTGSKKVLGVKAEKKAAAPATVLSGALVDGATIKVNFKWRAMNDGDYVQGVYNAASGTFTVSKGGYCWGIDGRAVYKVEKSGDNIIIGAGFSDYNTEGMVWTFNTTNDTYTTTNGADVKQFPTEYGLISVTLNGTDITSTLSELK